MIRALLVFMTAFALMPSVPQAAELLLGTVEAEMDGQSLVTIIQEKDRPRVLPEELVKIQSQIPGIDEVVESAKGYVYGTAKGSFQVKITEGEPALGEEVILLRGEFLNGEAPIDENIWQRMGYEDLRKGINKPANPGAACALAKMHVEGAEVEKNEYDAYVMYYLASKHEPSADCAAEYGMRLLSGDQNNNPPKWEMNPEEGIHWVKYAAERGSYMGMSLYAMSLETIGNSAEAKIWFKKAIKNEPEEHKGKAQKIWDAVRGQMR